jgi:hypothetical protein
MYRWTVWVALALSSALSAGCAAEPVDLSVELVTDLPPTLGFTEVRAELWRPDEPPFAREVLDEEAIMGLPGETPFVSGVVVGEFPNLVPGRYVARVTLYAEDRRIRASRTISLDLTEDTVLTLSILATCGGGDGVGCNDSGAGDAECSGGACAASGCICTATEIGCDADSECTSPVSCGLGRCIDGQCFVVAGAGCAPIEFCDPLSGCVPRMVLPPDPADCGAVSLLPGVVQYRCDIDAEMGTSDCAGPVTANLRAGVDQLSRANIDTAGGTTLEIVLGVCDPSDYVFHLGNSATNDGSGGDAGTTDYDSEMEIRGTVFNLFLNDVVGSGLGERVTGYLPEEGCVTRRIVVRDREVELADVPVTFTGDGIFRIDPDPTMVGEGVVHLGLNGVVTGRSDRTGSGARCASIRIYE